MKGQNFNDTNAVCAAPFTATREEVEVYFYPSNVTKLKFAKVFNLGKIFLSCIKIHLLSDVLLHTLILYYQVIDQLNLF